MAVGTTQWMHDVFVSYARADNEIPEGSSARYGWITTLARNLNVGPNVRKKDVFIDHRLQPGDAFSEDLVAKVEGSTVLVLLLSQNYIDSAWCGKELEHFVRRYASAPERPPDAFVVELHPYEKLVGVPKAIENLRKQRIHAKFWHQPADAGTALLAGYPTPVESGDEGQRHYWRVLNELRAAIDERLHDAQLFPAAVSSSAATVVKRTAPATWSTVLLADVTDDLEAQRSSVKAALEAEGIAVVPQGDYVGLGPQEFEERFAADLARAERFVQLLSPTVGRKGALPAPLPQMQFQRASASTLPIMQWCERLPEAGAIADAGHAALFGTQTLRATHLAGFQAEVINALRAARAQREKAAGPPGQAAPSAGRKLVFVDDLASQPDLNDKLRAIIKAENCDIRRLPPTAPLGNNGIDVKQVLKPCRAGITVYANRDQFLTVYNRLVFFLNQIADGGLPVARWGIYLEHGTVQSEFGIDSDDVVPVSERDLADFLRRL